MAGVSCALIGVGMVLVAAALDDCAAFGGTCPRPSRLDGDVFGTAGVGAGLAVGVPLFVARPTRHRMLIASNTALVTGLAVGWMVMVSTAT